MQYQNDLGGGVAGMNLSGDRFGLDDERQHLPQQQPQRQRGRQEFSPNSLHGREEEEKTFGRHDSDSGHRDTRFDRSASGGGGGGGRSGERSRVRESGREDGEGGGYGAYGHDEEVRAR